MLKATILAWAVFVAASDLRQRRIPNLLSLGAAAMALLVLVTHGSSALGGTLASALMAAGIAIALTLPAYSAHALGAGDVKLAVAMGLLSDTLTLGVGFVVGALLAGIWAVVWLLRQRAALSAPLSTSSEAMRDLAMPAVSRRPVPFGAALCAGFAVSLLLRGMTQGV